MRKTKEGRKEYSREYYLKNKERIRARSKQSRQDRRNWFTEIKSEMKCNRCGFSHTAALDFHHKDPGEKEFKISDIRHGSKEKILKEINKCEILCANCHRVHHYKEIYG